MLPTGTKEVHSIRANSKPSECTSRKCFNCDGKLHGARPRARSKILIVDDNYVSQRDEYEGRFACISCLLRSAAVWWGVQGEQSKEGRRERVAAVAPHYEAAHLQRTPRREIRMVFRGAEAVRRRPWEAVIDEGDAGYDASVTAPRQKEVVFSPFASVSPSRSMFCSRIQSMLVLSSPLL